ncbi:MAG: hypothetical protein ACHQSE_15850, partial [Gemmatimonadales bacterium]
MVIAVPSAGILVLPAPRDDGPRCHRLGKHAPVLVSLDRDPICDTTVRMPFLLFAVSLSPISRTGSVCFNIGAGQISAAATAAAHLFGIAPHSTNA